MKKCLCSISHGFRVSIICCPLLLLLVYMSLEYKRRLDVWGNSLHRPVLLRPSCPLWLTSTCFWPHPTPPASLLTSAPTPLPLATAILPPSNLLTDSHPPPRTNQSAKKPSRAQAMLYFRLVETNWLLPHIGRGGIDGSPDCFLILREGLVMGHLTAS